MRYYTQNVMKLELTKEEMACLKKFASFLDEYEKDIDDNANIICDIIANMEDMDYDMVADREFMKNEYHINIEVI